MTFDELTRNQERAVLALLTASTIKEAAAQAQISEPTLYRWLKEPAFREAWVEARRLAVGEALSPLSRATSRAMQVLLEVMDSPRSVSTAKVSAAWAVLESALRFVELDALEKRIVVLERRMGKM